MITSCGEAATAESPWNAHASHPKSWGDAVRALPVADRSAPRARDKPAWCESERHLIHAEAAAAEGRDDDALAAFENALPVPPGFADIDIEVRTVSRP